MSGPKTTRLGSGRFWVIDVEYHNQDGTLVGVESYTGFGYRRSETGPAGQPQESGRAESAAPAEVSGPRAKPDPAHDQIRAGDTLPEIVHDVTATTVVLGALASRGLAAHAPRLPIRHRAATAPATSS